MGAGASGGAVVFRWLITTFTQIGDLASADSQALPVLDDGYRRLVGWVSHRSVLATLDTPAASATPQP